MPLAFCRITLALRYLQYVVTLPNSHLARAALRDSFALYMARKPGWVSDLVIMPERLAPEVSLPNEDSLTSDSIKGMMDGVKRASAAQLQSTADATSCLYLLHGRLEPKKGKPPRQVTIMLSHYLEISCAKH